MVVRVERRGWVVFAAVAAAAVVAVPAGLKAAGVANPWWLVGAGVVAAVAAVFAKVWLDRYGRMVTRRDERDLSVLDGCLVIGRGRLPTVRQISDPRWLGVHPANRLADAENGSVLPAYVPRDVDEELHGLIARGGFVLLVGDSTAGKTRTAYEAVMATVPDHVAIAPKNRQAVAAAVDRAVRATNCVLWLNDLEHYLGADGLTRDMVAKVLSGQGHPVVVATIRSAELSRFTEEAAGDDQSRQNFREARAVLELAGEGIRVERRFSSPERDRAQDRAWDPRIADALEHSGDYGLAEYLAAGPELLTDWRNGWEPGTHPRGAALVAAAVDCRRAGLQPPLPARLLDELVEDYLARRGGARLRPESVEQAWEWATRPRRATTALLDGAVKAGFDVFDYLVDVSPQAACSGQAADRQRHPQHQGVPWVVGVAAG
ncbi:tetratricopeptide repeat protein [Solihabitans fulvus]|uniref:Tetratricopeptide repeat protein n=1 Tax=Solihabitans fulvus TaxID=1892852 RepID=A0A5B2XMY7_9PSEU|nr:tetratricopeptide repeat protein [Solihabitans fulvus]KAA2264324.1 tetratricopeptide repeat protein [Solihabitans fulvus]